jgi:hypothetical protein
MKFKALIAAIVLGLTLPVFAQFRTIEEAYEVRLSDLRLPQNEAGTVAYKTCDTCPYLRHVPVQDHARQQQHAMDPGRQ